MIVAGFQGVSDQLEITSLGRGGSDTTAVAMAAALGADYVEICSDVDGVYSTDPRLTQSARRVDELSYDEMQVLADSGAKVLNADAVEWAKRSGVEVRCVATHDRGRQGTSIRAALQDSDLGHAHQQLSAVTHHPELLRVSGRGMIPQKLPGCLKVYGAVDAEIHQCAFSGSETIKRESNWECWISLLNIHQQDQLIHSLKDLGAHRIERGWSWVTLVGRSLLSVTVGSTPDQKDEEHNLGFNTLSKEAHGNSGGYDLVERAEQLMKSAHLSATPLSFTSNALRWSIRLEEAPQAVQLLHEQLISSQSHVNVTPSS